MNQTICGCLDGLQNHISRAQSAGLYKDMSGLFICDMLMGGFCSSVFLDSGKPVELLCGSSRPYKGLGTPMASVIVCLCEWMSEDHLMLKT
jgi:hypothetical protein